MVSPMTRIFSRLALSTSVDMLGSSVGGAEQAPFRQARPPPLVAGAWGENVAYCVT